MQKETPVIIAVGQFTNHGSDFFSPQSLIEKAVFQALNEIGIDTKTPAQLAASIDTIVACRLFVDSSPLFDSPFGNTNNLPRSVAKRIGAEPDRAIYGELGGHSPQHLLTELCESIHLGESKMALLVGGEAIRSTKSALKQGLRLDWSESVDGSLDDRGVDFSEATPYELAHGIGMPIQTYSFFEQALREQYGDTVEQYRQRMAELFAPFSQVAANNPYAQYPVARDVSELVAPSKENYPLTDVYTKYLVAQDNVDQAGAILVTSDSYADELAVPRSQRVYLHGYSNLKDSTILQRPKLNQSRAMSLAGERALSSSGVAIRDIAVFEIYSCFPSAVMCAQAAFGLEHVKPSDMTVTGGLPYFGGAGNSYSMFGIAEMVSRLRGTEQLGLVLANGGYMSKESIAIYSGKAPENWQPIDSADLQDQISNDPQTPTVLTQYNGVATIECYVVKYTKGAPEFISIIARTPEQSRFMALNKTEDIAELTEAFKAGMVGRSVTVESLTDKNVFELA